MRKLFAGAIFFVLNVLMLPVTLIGYVIWVGKGMLSARFSSDCSSAARAHEK